MALPLLSKEFPALEVPAPADRLRRTRVSAKAAHPGVSDNTRVILYGDTSVLPATRAYFTLDYLGHGDRAALLDGGLEKWRSEGRMLTKDAPTVAAGNLTPRLNPEIVMQIDTVKDITAKGGQ